MINIFKKFDFEVLILQSLILTTEKSQILPKVECTDPTQKGHVTSKKGINRSKFRGVVVGTGGCSCSCSQSTDVFCDIRV